MTQSLAKTLGVGFFLKLGVSLHGGLDLTDEEARLALKKHGRELRRLRGEIGKASRAIEAKYAAIADEWREKRRTPHVPTDK